MREPIREGEIRPLSMSVPQNREKPENAVVAEMASGAAATETNESEPQPCNKTPNENTVSAPARHWVAAVLFSYLPAWVYVRTYLVANQSNAALGLGWLEALLGRLAFCLLYLVWIELLARGERRAANRETPFWVGIWLVQSVAMTLQPEQAGGLAGWQALVWHLVAIWIVLCRMGMLAQGKTGCLAFLDVWAGMFSVPWTNFVLRLTTLWRAGREALRRRAQSRTSEEASARRKHMGVVLVSVLAALAVCAFAWGELAAADAHFAALGNLVRAWLPEWRWDWAEQAVYLVLSLPVGAWLFGLIGGSARLGKAPIPAERFFAGLVRWQKLPAFTVNTVLGALCGVYGLFFALQAVEFSGASPALTAPTAAAFAVSGFWNLLRLLMLNFAILAVLRFFFAAPLQSTRAPKVLATLLCLFGLAFAGLELAKLGTYIVLFGYTPRRMVAGWFLLVLVVWCVLALLWALGIAPRWDKARTALLVLAAAFTLLCCCDLNALVVRGNVQRFAAGQDETIDLSVLEECGITRWNGRDGFVCDARYTRWLAEADWFRGRTEGELLRIFWFDTQPWDKGAECVLSDGTVLQLTFEKGICTGAKILPGA